MEGMEKLEGICHEKTGERRTAVPIDCHMGKHDIAQVHDNLEGSDPV